MKRHKQRKNVVIIFVVTKLSNVHFIGDLNPHFKTEL